MLLLDNLYEIQGWLVRDTSGNLTEHWAGTKGIGNILGTDQLYYNLDGSPIDYTFTGAPNQAVQIISDPNGDGDYADGFNNSASFEIFNREEGQILSSANLTDIGETSLLAPKVFSFAVGTGTDNNIVATDTEVETLPLYTGMSITYHATSQSRSIGGSSYDFGVIVDGNGGTKQQIYTFLNYELRNINDIDEDADVKIGKLQSLIAQFDGTNITTLPVTNLDGGGSGVFIDNFDNTEINDWSFTDNLGASVTFPTLAPFTINFNDVAQGDSTFKYWAYFADPNQVTDSNEWGTAGGILLQDNAPADITGLVGGSPSITKTIDYDNLNLGGHTPGSPINVVVVGIGIEANGGKYVRATGVINAQGGSVSLVAGLDRQFNNPV